MKAKAIIVGNFAAKKQAAVAIDRLLGACVHGDHVHTIFLNSASRGGSYPDSSRKKSSRTHGNRRGAKDASTATAVELRVKPDAAAGGIGVRAFSGPPAGITGVTNTEGRQAPAQPHGIMIAVETSDYVSQFLALSVLDQCGARDIQRADDLGQVRSWRGLDQAPLSAAIDVSRRGEESRQAALLRPKANPPRHH